MKTRAGCSVSLRKVAVSQGSQRCRMKQHTRFISSAAGSTECSGRLRARFCIWWFEGLRVLQYVVWQLDGFRVSESVISAIVDTRFCGLGDCALWMIIARTIARCGARIIYRHRPGQTQSFTTRDLVPFVFETSRLWIQRAAPRNRVHKTRPA